MKNLQNLTKYQQKTLNRFSHVEKSVGVLKHFYDIGFHSKRDLFTLLCIHFPKYFTDEGKAKFSLLWSCVQFDKNLVNDLEALLQKLNNQ